MTPIPDAPPWLRGGRIPSLDGLRAIAVILVVLAHAHQTRGFPDIPVLHAVAHRGRIGVEVFFVISGFLITTLMFRELDRRGRLSIGAFYLRRVLRIVPAYLCLLAVVAALQAAGHAHLTRRDWIAAATYTVNFLRKPAWEIGHAWSLSIEEHFYLMWPLVIAAFPPRVGRSVALGSLAFCGLARWAVILVSPSSSPMAELWTFTRMDTIAAGCLLAFLARDPTWRARLAPTMSGAFVAVNLVVLVTSLTLSAFSAKFAVGIAYTLNTACLTLLLWAAVARPVPLLNHPLLGAIGVGSYSIYLWQQLFLDHDKPGMAHAFPLNVLLAFLAAFLSYRLVERPFLNLKGKLSRQAESRPGPEADGEPPVPEKGRSLSLGVIER